MPARSGLAVQSHAAGMAAESVSVRRIRDSSASYSIVGRARETPGTGERRGAGRLGNPCWPPRCRAGRPGSPCATAARWQRVIVADPGTTWSPGTFGPFPISTQRAVLNAKISGPPFVPCVRVPNGRADRWLTLSACDKNTGSRLIQFTENPSACSLRIATAAGGGTSWLRRSRTVCAPGWTPGSDDSVATCSANTRRVARGRLPTA